MMLRGTATRIHQLRDWIDEINIFPIMLHSCAGSSDPSGGDSLGSDSILTSPRFDD